MTTIVIVGKLGDISEYKVKKINIEELYKKCGYRKNEGFNKVGNWKVKMENEIYLLEDLHVKVSRELVIEDLILLIKLNSLRIIFIRIWLG